MRQMAVNLAGVELKNPVMTASGTFGSGAEYGEMVDLNKLGAVVTKGVLNPETGMTVQPEDHGHLIARRANYRKDNLEAPEIMYQPQLGLCEWR